MSKTKQSIKPNNSKFDAGKAKVLKILQNLYSNGTGSVSYIFVSERIKFTKENPLGEVIKVKTTQHTSISNQVFYKLENNRVVRRSFEEVLKVFEDTKNDLGASYFIIG
jgi:hypothetical protein